MKKETIAIAGLVVFVVIASIVIFAVTPSMSTSTSFKIDGKLTSDEMEMLEKNGVKTIDHFTAKEIQMDFPNIHSAYRDIKKVEKNRISASAEDIDYHVYEAGLLPKFLEDLINKLIEFISGVNPEDVGEDLYEQARGGGTEKAGGPSPTPVAEEAIGEYVGPKELIIDGKLSEEEKGMLELMGVKEIEFGRGRSTYYTADGGVAPGVNHSMIAFLGNDLYFYEEAHSKVAVEVRPEVLGHITFKPSKSEYPIISCNFDKGRCCLIENEEELFKGTDFLDSFRKFEIEGKQLENKTEYVVKDIYSVIKKKIGNDVRIRTLGGGTKLKLSDIKKIDSFN